jgi:hypothetical protein
MLTAWHWLLVQSPPLMQTSSWPHWALVSQTTLHPGMGRHSPLLHWLFLPHCLPQPPQSVLLVSGPTQRWPHWIVPLRSSQSPLSRHETPLSVAVHVCEALHVTVVLVLPQPVSIRTPYWLPAGPRHSYV